MMSDHSQSAAGQPDLRQAYADHIAEARLDQIQDIPTNELDLIFDPADETVPEALSNIEFTLAMLTDRLDFMERTLSAIQLDLRYCMQWLDRNDVA